MVKVAVVIPAYNASRYLRETVESVLASESVQPEIVVVDDGSTDSTVSVAHELALENPGVIRVFEQRNAGVSVARNTGFDHASTDCVCFLDADDRLRPHALRTLQELLSENERNVAAYGRVSYIDQNSDRLALPTRKSTMRSGDLLAHILEGNLVDTPGAVLFRSSAVRRVGGFKAGLRRSQDWEFYVRVAQQGDIIACDDVVIDYRLHGESLSHERSNTATFDEALTLAFAGVRSAGMLPESLLERLEARRRASTLRLIAIRSRGLSWDTLSALLRICATSGYDAKVVRTTVRTILSALKGMLAGKKVA